MKTRRKFNSEFKTMVVLDALKERQTIGELAQKYEVHPNQINTWQREFKQKASVVFSSKVETSFDSVKEKDTLYKIIGQQKLEIDFLKKALS